jgi:serine phosphatase RsbU (regulator of sigma subunit)
MAELVEAKQERDRKPNEAFEIYLHQIIHDWLRVLTILGWTLMPIFFGLDVLTIPPQYRYLLPTFAIYRAMVTVIVLSQYFVIRRSKPTQWSPLHGYFFTFAVGGTIVLMTVDLGGYDSRYYAGLMLVLTAVNMLLPWKTIHSAINGVMCIGMYIAINAFAGKPFSAENLVSNVYFLSGIVIISCALTAVKNNLIRKEWDQRAQITIAHAQLATAHSQLAKVKDALWSEMEVAKRIQTSLLPHGETLPGFDISAIMLPAEEVGGDYYDFITTPRGNWITIGDVSGHGVETGLIMMMAQTSIRSVIANTPGVTPAGLLTQVNSVIKENISRLGVARYMTVSAILLDGNEMVISGMHQDVIVYRAKLQKTERVPTEGVWLGVVDDIVEYVKDVAIELEDEDIILLFTDGITEAANAEGEMFGDERLEAALNEYSDLPVDEIVSKIIGTVMLFKDTITDDMTLVIARKIGQNRVDLAAKK